MQAIQDYVLMRRLTPGAGTIPVLSSVVGAARTGADTLSCRRLMPLRRTKGWGKYHTLALHRQRARPWTQMRDAAVCVHAGTW
eukprot:258763-Chlamydomonas_euryale.AAC.7